MKNVFISLLIVLLAACTEKQEALVQPSFSNLEISLKSIDPAASYTVWLDGEQVLDSLNLQTVLSRITVTDTMAHQLSFKNNARPGVMLDTLIHLGVPGSKYNLVELDTAGTAPPFFRNEEEGGSDVPDGHYMAYLSWQQSKDFPPPPVKLPDSLQVLLYQVKEDYTIVTPPKTFNIPANGNITAIPVPLINDPLVFYIFLFKDYKTGKLLPSYNNIPVGPLFDFTAGIPIPSFNQPQTSRHLYIGIYYLDPGYGEYDLQAVNMLEY